MLIQCLNGEEKNGKVERSTTGQWWDMIHKLASREYMRNQYDKEFRVKVCKDIEKGVSTVSQISKIYVIFCPIVSRWVSEYSI